MTNWPNFPVYAIEGNKKVLVCDMIKRKNSIINPDKYGLSRRNGISCLWFTSHFYLWKDMDVISAPFTIGYVVWFPKKVLWNTSVSRVVFF